jgi:tetratricopeptide (TPR) repeat protein
MDSQMAAEAAARRVEQTLAAARAGDLAGAIGLAERALGEGLTDPLFFKLRAVRHERSGRLEQAIEDFRSALALSAEDFAALSALGLCLARAGRLGEALAAFDGSISLEPGYAPAHANRGWALEMAGDRAGARAAYQRALALDPGAVPALGGLAMLAARSGDPGLAVAYAERALALAPGDAAANLAMAAAALAHREAGAATQRLRALLADPALPEHERGVTLSLLGDALDLAGQTEPAFDAYASANATLERLYARAPQDEETASVLAGRLLEAFERTGAGAWRRRPAPEPPMPFAAHLFVVGFPRSGTTLLGQILAAHPGAVVLDEQELLAEPARAFLRSADGLDRLSRLEPEALAPWRRAYHRRIAELADATGRLLVDKLPMNALGLPLIARLFPEARVLLVRRDPRDVVLSCFRRQFAASAVSRELFTLEGAARLYDQVMRLTELYLAKLDLDVRVQGYEDLVADFEGQTRGICRFAGLEWTPDLSRFGEARQALEVATPSAAQVRRGLYQDGAGQWRRYRRQLEPVQPLLEPWIRSFGYAPG